MSKFASFELKEFDSASLTAAFQTFGTALSNPAYHLEIDNTSDVDVYISIDGSNNTWRIAAGAILPIPSYQRHNTLNEASYVLKSGTQLQIKQVTAAGTGFIIANIYTAG